MNPFSVQEFGLWCQMSNGCSRGLRPRRSPDGPAGASLVSSLWVCRHVPSRLQAASHYLHVQILVKRDLQVTLMAGVAP